MKGAKILKWFISLLFFNQNLRNKIDPGHCKIYNKGNNVLKD